MPKLLTLVIADDDAAIVDALTMVLEEEYQVISAQEHEVVNVVETVQPAAVLLDIWMSGADGREICKQLKALPTTRAIPVIFLSASKDVAQSAAQAGATTYLEKPFEIQTVLDVVAEVVQRQISE